MRISVPGNSVYYYDPGLKEDPVLLCWMPRKVLEEKVKNESVSKEILVDYPDGLDLEISEDQLNRFQEKYGLIMPYRALEILVNFEAFQRSRKVKTLGFIEAIALDSAIEKTRFKEETHQLLEKIESRTPPEVIQKFITAERTFAPTVAQIQKEYKRSPTIQERFDANLDEIKYLIEDYMPEKAPPEERVFGMPEMTEGGSPIEFFFRFQQRSKGGK